MVVQLEAAAQDLLAPPSLVTSERRHLAEKVFLDFQKSDSLIPICRYALDKSSNDYVLFQAASGIKQAVLRDWSLMEGSDIEVLRSDLLAYVTRKAGLAPFTREQILQVVAIIMKRGWLDEEKSSSMKKVFFEQIMQLLGMEIGMKNIACSLMLRVVEEFSTSSKSSDVGFTWEFHYKCKLNFEQTALKQICDLCLQVLKQFNGAISLSALAPGEVELLKNMTGLADKIVGWDFAVGKTKRCVGSFEPDQDVLLRPGPNWRDEFLNEERINLFFDIHCKIRADSQVSHYSLQCLAQLASLSGSIFENEGQEALYLSYMTKGVVKLISCIVESSAGATDIVDIGAELYGLASVINRLVLNFKGSIFMYLGEDQFSALVGKMMDLTTFCLLRTTSDFEDTFNMEAFDQLLGAWDQFTSFDCFGPHFFQQPAARIFEVYVDTRLRRARLEVETYNDEEELTDDDTAFDDQLCGVALLGRYSARETCLYLKRMLLERIDALEGALNPSAPVQDLTGLYEDLHWLLLVAGHFLADCGEGEKPLIPEKILNLSIEASLNNVEDDVLALASLVFRLVEIENKTLMSAMADRLSPLLGENIVWFLARWLKTYLLPDENDYRQLSQNIVNHFGRDSASGRGLAEIIMTKICINLTLWKGEAELQEQSVQAFLNMAKLSQVRNVIIQSDNLWTLANTFADPKSDLSRLPGPVQQHLMHAMCCVCSGTDEQRFLHRLESILKLIEHRFTGLLQKPNFQKMCQQPAVMTEIVNLMELFRGCCLSSDARNTRLLFPFFSRYFDHIVSLLRVYKNCPETSVYVLEFFKDFVKHQIGYLSDDECTRVYETSLQLMKLYADCNMGKYKKSDPNAEEEQYYDLLLFLKIMTYLLSKDFVDFSEAEPRVLASGTSVEIADVVLYGVTIVLPFMTKELLCFPKLGFQYYKLINVLCELYPQKVSSCQEQVLQNIVGSLEIGLHAFTSDISRFVFESVAALGSFNYKEELRGSEVGGMNTPISNALQKFLKLIFEMFLFQSFDMDLLEAASDAFFALICYRHSIYTSLVQELLVSQAESKYKVRSEAAFASLLAANGGVQPVYDRVNKSKFRKNLSFFLMEVRAFFRRK